MTIKEFLVEMENSFPADAEVLGFKVKAKLQYSTRTIEGPRNGPPVSVKSFGREEAAQIVERLGDKTHPLQP